MCLTRSSYHENKSWLECVGKGCVIYLFIYFFNAAYVRSCSKSLGTCRARKRRCRSAWKETGGAGGRRRLIRGDKGNLDRKVRQEAGGWGRKVQLPPWLWGSRSISVPSVKIERSRIRATARQSEVRNYAVPVFCFFLICVYVFCSFLRNI